MLGVGWLEEKLKNTHHCPVCGSVHEKSNVHLEELRSLGFELKSLTASVHQAPAKLDQEVLALRRELRGLEAAITRTRQKRKLVETKSNELSAQRQRVRQVYLFVGRVEQALENVRTSQNIDDLSDKMRILASKISELRRALDPRRQRGRLTTALDTVSAKVAAYAQLLQLEYATEVVRLLAAIKSPSYPATDLPPNRAN